MNQPNGIPAVDLAVAQGRTVQQLVEEHQRLIEAVQQLTAERDQLKQQLAKATAEGEQYRKSLHYYLEKDNPISPMQLVELIAECQRDQINLDDVIRELERLEDESHD